MICYKDKTFCPFYASCANGSTCHMALTPEVQAGAEKWWGKPNAPICTFTTEPECFNQKKEVETEMENNENNDTNYIGHITRDTTTTRRTYPFESLQVGQYFTFDWSKVNSVKVMVSNFVKKTNGVKIKVHARKNMVSPTVTRVL